MRIVKTVLAVILILALLATAGYGFNTTRDRDSVSALLKESQSALSATQEQLSSLSTGLSSAQAQIDSLNKTVTSLQAELSTTKSQLAAREAELQQYKQMVGVAVLNNVQPPYHLGVETERVNLINNPNATDPTWQNLKAFLLANPTDDYTYVDGLFVCGDFAQMLYNNAEAAGIRAAFVTIDFVGEKVGHAVNAFQTTDRGLVYIDCTGRGLQSSTSSATQVEYDKIAYLAKGKEAGYISLSPNVQFTYDYYEHAKADWDAYRTKLNVYNIELTRFSLDAGNYTEGSAGWLQIKERQASLDDQKKTLDSLRAQLEMVWNPMGTVARIVIWW